MAIASTRASIASVAWVEMMRVVRQAATLCCRMQTDPRSHSAVQQQALLLQRKRHAPELQSKSGSVRVRVVRI